AVTARAVRPVPSWTAGRLSPISPALSPRSVTLPSPRRPLAPSPQHLTVPLSNRTQVNALPAVTATAVRPVPRATALRLSPISLALSPRARLSPRPSWPCPLLPQHFTWPLSSRAQVWLLPVATARATRPAPRLTAGRLSPISPAASPRARVSPWPRRPLPLAPQHLTWSLSSRAQVWPAP